MKKSKTPCKPGKTPTGKNGRCVQPKTKKCKPGKMPTGKNGRCVSLKTIKRPSKSAAIRDQIHQYMVQLDDQDFFSKAEIDSFVKIAVSRELSHSDINKALDEYPKGYGAFA
jgi:hypothetical protein